MSFESVNEFENQVAHFFGAPYAVAVDSCTHALELCLRYQDVKHSACPKHTYLSVPMTFEKLGIKYRMLDAKWKEYYHLANTNIIDAAVTWRENSYVPNTFMCISFQFKKHLSLGRGGIILCSNQKDRDELVKLSYDGRLRAPGWEDQNIETVGYHYYMTPETARYGLSKLQSAKNKVAKTWSWKDYPNLTTMPIFHDK